VGSGHFGKKSVPGCELFPMTPVLVETGHVEDQSYA
jgi:hypothetical protein